MWTFVLGVVPIALGIYIAVSEWKGKRGPLMAAVALVLVGFIDGCWSSRREEHQAAERAAFQDRVTALQGEIKALVLEKAKEGEARALLAQADAERRAAAERDLQVRTLEASRHAIGAATGGGSFAYFDFMRGFDGSIWPSVVSEGPHPIYELSAEILDWDTLEEVGRLSPRLSPSEEISRTRFLVSIGNMPAGFVRQVHDQVPFRFGARKTRRFKAFFTARNGSWTQELYFSKVEGTMKQATRVWRDSRLVLNKAWPTREPQWVLR